MNDWAARSFFDGFLLRDSIFDQLDRYWFDFLFDWGWAADEFYWLLLERFRVAYLNPRVLFNFIFNRAVTFNLRRSISRIPKQVRILYVSHSCMFSRPKSRTFADTGWRFLPCVFSTEAHVLLRSLHRKRFSRAGRAIHENIAVLPVQKCIRQLFTFTSQKYFWLCGRFSKYFLKGENLVLLILPRTSHEY